jgi:hypothetical protein
MKCPRKKREVVTRESAESARVKRGEDQGLECFERRIKVAQFPIRMEKGNKTNECTEKKEKDRGSRDVIGQLYVGPKSTSSSNENKRKTSKNRGERRTDFC